MKKVVVMSTSLRPGSNRRSATLWSQQPRYGGANSHAMAEPTATLWRSQQPRYGGANSHALAEQFAEGAKAAGHKVESYRRHTN